MEFASQRFYSIESEELESQVVEIRTVGMIEKTDETELHTLGLSVRIKKVSIIMTIVQWKKKTWEIEQTEVDRQNTGTQRNLRWLLLTFRQINNKTRI